MFCKRSDTGYRTIEQGILNETPWSMERGLS